MDIEEKIKKSKIRLDRCKTCNKPNVGPDGKCPGNCGIGCLGDWRCCLEISMVCEKCDKCKEKFMDIYNCDDRDCEDMEKFQNNS